MGYSEYDIIILPAVLFCIVSVSVCLSLVLRNKREWVVNIPFVTIAVLLLVLEVMKQLENVMTDFSYYALPFHYCSLFLITIPLAELGGKRLSSVFRPLAFNMSFIVSVGIYLFPGGILGNASELFGKDFFHTHSFIFHHLIILYFVLSVFMKRYRPRLCDGVSMLTMGMIFVAVAIPVSYIFDTNYANFLSSAVPPLEKIRLCLGQTVYTSIIAIAHTVGTLLCSVIYYYLYKLIAHVRKLRDGCK